MPVFILAEKVVLLLRIQSALIMSMRARTIGVVGAILIGGAILIICASNLRNSLPNNMDPDKYFSGYNL